MRKLLLVLALFGLASGLSAQTTIWSINPSLGPDFNSYNGGVSGTGTMGEITTDGSGWGLAFYTWTSLDSPMASTNLADYTLNVDITASATDDGVGIFLNFRDSGGVSLAAYRPDWITLSAGSNDLSWTLEDMVPSSSDEPDPLEGSEFGDVTQIEFFVGGISTTDAVFQFGEQSLSMDAVPEPSTYAAIAGVLALGLAFWRRRK